MHAAASTESDIHATMQALFSGGPDIAGWTSRGLMHWFIDQNWMNLLDDFKDISGGHLYKLRSQIYDWLRDEKSIDDFPVKIRGSDADKEHKINSLRSMAHALLQRYPFEPDDNVPAARQRQKAEIGEKKMEHLTRWKLTVNTLQACHKDSSLWYSRRATGLTVFVVALNAIISSAMFSSIQESGDENSYQTTVRVIAACLSITSGIAAAVRSALRLETVSEQHSAAARRFGKLYVRFNDICDMLEIEYNPGGGEKASEWKDWFKDYMDVMEQAPMIDDSQYDAMVAKMTSKTSAVKRSSVKPVPQEPSSHVGIVPS
eukprot:TRINITY_DN62400_c0_g1_i1.p1 TRINITY_DN62400_c0_g1~~TRINITY_DN62400_c0_g1_i1.p1  ORF type:complete len:317 (-),score=68.17 TRINITY_DN62400_c0_g1_i1:133-1083(-)